MARYQCMNKSCDNYGKISDDLSVWQRYTVDGVIDMNEECPGCDKPRIIIESKEKDGLCTSMHGGQNLCNK